MFIKCDLLGKTWFPYYEHNLVTRNSMVCITIAAKQSKTKTFKNACISKISNNDGIEPLH